MIRLSANYSKKVPGSEQYSSEQASASVEVEIAEGEGPQIQSKLAELWLVVRGAVEQQLRAKGQTSESSHPASSQGNTPAGTNRGPETGRNGQASCKAAVSEKQMKFIKSLVGELKPLGVDFAFVEGLCNRLFGRRLDHLDRAQASTLIGHLNEIKAGRLSLQQALAA